jgi:hypothetical protein
MGAQAVALGGAGLTISPCSCPGVHAPDPVAVKRSVADGPGRIDLIRVDCGERVQDGTPAA